MDALTLQRGERCEGRHSIPIIVISCCSCCKVYMHEDIKCKVFFDIIVKVAVFTTPKAPVAFKLSLHRQIQVFT